MAGKIFISYRRHDSRYQARMIYDAFRAVLPRDHLFMDIDTIPVGADFVEVLEQWVDQSETMLVLIGPGWIDAIDAETGRRRLENPNDFVRIEVGAALRRGITVVPVLLDRSPVPDPNQLPEDLKKLARRQAEFVEFRTFDADVGWLISKLGLREGSPTPKAREQAPTAVEKICAEGRVKVNAKFRYGVPDGWFAPGAGKTEWFKDLDVGPEMVVVPAGSFMMGSPETEEGRSDDEGPQHKVTFEKPFAVGRFAVTFDEWDACVADGGCKRYEPKDEGWGRGRRPVINVSWNDARAYVAWLSKKTGKAYRLLSEAEWEYVARAGTTTPFWWGSLISSGQCNYNGNYTYGKGVKGGYRQRTVAVNSFEPNPWGLYQVHGNVWEWTEDCYDGSYRGAPTDGSVWTSGDCGHRVLRGGCWSSLPEDLRSAERSRGDADDRYFIIGFRVAGASVTP